MDISKRFSIFLHKILFFGKRGVIKKNSPFKKK
jgi:hypothetical protein